VTPRAEVAEDGFVKIGDVVAQTRFSRPFITGLFDDGVLPGIRVGGERRVLGGFIADLLAEVRCGGPAVDLRSFAAQWKTAQAQGRPS